jgi:hypothetical protein
VYGSILHGPCSTWFREACISKYCIMVNVQRQMLPRYNCIVPGNKDEKCPTSPFKHMPIPPFTITILCDAQSILYSCIISINCAKFHFPRTKTPFVMNFFISFSLFYVKIDQEMLVMNFINLIAHLCRKHHCTQHTLTRNLKNL